jgi:trk system potassium uptake protein TrkH
MWSRFSKLPLLISIPGVFVSMFLIPAVYAFGVGALIEGRTFLYAFVLGLFLIGFLGVAIETNQLVNHRYNQLWSLVAFFLGLPLFLAIPLNELSQVGSFLDAYLDMVSVITTTGLPIFEIEYSNDTLLIWRVFIGWASGFMMWVFAWTVFAPLNLGGFEHLQGHSENLIENQIKASVRQQNSAAKFWREAVRLAPVYLFITFVAAALIKFVGNGLLFSILSAMTAMATFGIKIPGAASDAWWYEIILMVVMCFALSRALFTRTLLKNKSLRKDPELRLAIILIVIVFLAFLFLHWSNTMEFIELLQNSWGVLFTSISFLTTTGFVSEYMPFKDGKLGTGALLMAALATFGGGVATTAGGVKLLRIFILVSHSKSEIDRLIIPSRVVSGQNGGQSGGFNNAMLACVFFMLFLITLAAILLGLALCGISVQRSLQLTLASLTNTGPLVTVMSAGEVVILDLPVIAKILLIFSMVFGRLEVLALLALLNPKIYR